MSKASKRRAWLRWSVLIIIGLAVAAWLAYPRVVGPRVTVVSARSGPLVQSIVTYGRVRPPARVTLAPLVTGRVVDVSADVGDEVTAGQVLLRLDDGEARAALASAQGQIDDASAQDQQARTVSTKDAKESVERARTRVDEARRTHERIKTLFEDGIASRETLEDAGTSLSLAESELRAARLQYTDVKGTRVARADAILRQAEAARDAAEARLGYHRIRSPFDGVVVERSVEPGDVVAAATSAMVIVRSGETELVVEPDERNLALLSAGLSAMGSAEAFPDDSFAAEVASIAPTVDPRRGTIEVRLSVPQPPAYLRPDMTVSVEIVVARKADALSLPAAYVRELASGRPWALVVEDGRAARRQLRVGIVGDGRVEILEGITASDRVIDPQAAVEPGDRVRPQPSSQPGPEPS